ncbi:unnamed protein product [Brassica oleracea]
MPCLDAPQSLIKKMFSPHDVTTTTTMPQSPSRYIHSCYHLSNFVMLECFCT